jgi:hypothetical protein
MKLIILFGALLATAPTSAQTQTDKAPVTNVSPAPALVQPQGRPGQTSSNPWDSLPAMTPYRKLADEIKAGAKQGEQSPLNPGCQGKTGDECVRSAKPPKR